MKDSLNEVVIRELTQTVKSYYAGTYIPVTPASWYFEKLRLLIEEREQLLTGNEFSKREAIKWNDEAVELRLKVAEQDEEIRKLEDLLHETNIKSLQFANQKIEESTEQLRFFREAIENLKDK